MEDSMSQMLNFVQNILLTSHDSLIALVNHCCFWIFIL